MNIQTEVLLSKYVTMGIGGPAKALVKIDSESQLSEARCYAKDNNLPIMTLGGGSNVIFKDRGFNGLVILNRIMGFNIDATNDIVEIGSGEVWDKIVQDTLNKSYCGIESMSYIPGRTGATPINNVGAYGQEIKDTLESVRAYDMENNRFVEFSNKECDFDYRNSRFKSYDWGKYIITKIRLRLNKTPSNYKIPEYQAIAKQLKDTNITKPKPIDVRNALKIIRTAKLPNPLKLANSGSFFKNPVVSSKKAQSLIKDYPNLPTYPQSDDKVKLAAGWMIEEAGLKGYRKNGIWVYDKQALVLVNESAKGFKDLETVYLYVVDTVYKKFGVKLCLEPDIV